MRQPDDRVYDFEGDAWVPTAAIRPPARELPAPSTPPSPGRWTARPTERTSSPPSTREGFLWIAIGVAAPILAVLCEQPVLLLGVLAIPVGTVTLAHQKAKPPSREDLRLLETGDDPDVCLVEITVIQRGRAWGSDRGVAWFEGGRLLFNGHRTSFAIGGEDVMPRSQWRYRYGDAQRLQIPLRASGSPSIEFVVIDGRDEAKRGFMDRCGEFRDRPPQSRGPRQWPPFP